MPAPSDDTTQNSPTVKPRPRSDLERGYQPPNRPIRNRYLLKVGETINYLVEPTPAAVGASTGAVGIVILCFGLTPRGVTTHLL